MYLDHRQKRTHLLRLLRVASGRTIDNVHFAICGWAERSPIRTFWWRMRRAYNGKAQGGEHLRWSTGHPIKAKILKRPDSEEQTHQSNLALLCLEFVILSVALKNSVVSISCKKQNHAIFVPASQYATYSTRHVVVVDLPSLWQVANGPTIAATTALNSY